jgi:hypothetical protein
MALDFIEVLPVEMKKNVRYSHQGTQEEQSDPPFTFSSSRALCHSTKIKS